MRYFFDTEFDEDGKTIELISIGIVAEDGREFYAVSTDFDPKHCNEWVQANVLPLLPAREDDSDRTWMPKDVIAGGVLDFVFGDPKPEFWAYYAAYDWVVMCQLFGRMIDLPPRWPMFCLDLKQLQHSLGNPNLPAQQSAEHHALADARWNQQVYDYLVSLR
jgi:hypothetical protein